MKKVLAAICALAMMSTFATGCGGSPSLSGPPDGSSVSQGTESAGEVELTYWAYKEEGTTMRKQLVDRFNEENAGKIKVNLEEIPWSGHFTKLTTALSANSGPDILEMKMIWFPQLMGLNGMEELSGYLDTWEGKDDIMDSMWDLVKTEDGGVYCIPFEMAGQILYYRKDIFEEKGLEPPKTIDEFFDIAKKLTIPAEQLYGYGLRGSRYGHEAWSSLILGNMQDPVFNAEAMKDPVVIEYNQKWIDSYKVDKTAPDSCITDGFDQLAANFQSGQTAMTIAHLKLASVVSEALGDKMGVMPIPAGKNGQRFTMVGDWEIAMNPASKNKDQAFAYMSWFTTKEQNKNWCSTLKSVPVCKSLAEDPDFSQIPVMVASMEALKSAGTIQSGDKVAEWTETLWPKYAQKALTDSSYNSGQMMQNLYTALAE